MTPMENIVDAIHSLNDDEKVKLRGLLDAELASQESVAPSTANGSERAKQIIGLFADEPELMDRVMESVYESRAQTGATGSIRSSHPTAAGRTSPTRRSPD